MVRHQVTTMRYKAAKPLLPPGHVQKGKYYLQTTPGPSPLDTEEGPLFMMRKKRKTSLVWFDAAIVILEMLQILALIQTMSMRWVWPKTWISYTYFLFLFNMDIWEFIKVLKGSFAGVQNYHLPSLLMPFSYNFIVLMWGLIVVGFIVAFIVAYICVRYRKQPYMLIQIARMERAVLILMQVLAIPLGVAVAKIFHCTKVTFVVVPLNELQCFVGLHWAYIAISGLILIVLFLIFPAWMIYRTRCEILASRSQHHETYLQLKEMEYMSGLDVIWMVKGFYIFSSFKLTAVYFRPFFHIFKLVLLVVYGVGDLNIFAQALSTSCALFILWIALIILRPFRISSFNVMLIFGYLCLIGDSVVGTCLAGVPPSEVLSPWLVEPYSTGVLIAVNILLLVGVLVFLVHLLIYNMYCHRRKGHSPMWPSMAIQGADKVSEETKKYMVAVLKARADIERCLNINPLFSPVHELSHQIQVVNAYFREAEKLGDGLHDTLWDLLDEMIQVHERLAPKSLFGDSVKDSIQQTAAELMKMMPMFSRRLAQRDYDLILVSPLKRRLLLKMLALGYFLNGRTEKVVKTQITGPETTHIWPESEKIPDVEDKMEYYEDLTPAPIQGPYQEQMYISESLTFPMQLVDIEEDVQSMSSTLKGAPELQLQSPATSRPGSRASYHRPSGGEGGEDNPAFEGDAGGKHEMLVTLEGYEPGETSTDKIKEELDKSVNEDVPVDRPSTITAPSPSHTQAQSAQKTRRKKSSSKSLTKK